MSRTGHHNTAAFTLLEVIISIAILSIFQPVHPRMYVINFGPYVSLCL